ncbi:hypothetical protein N7486_007730 [Penicillium sp. IBT 16267x]|nr:hypothetical protein N7486_007730 [Penicillium sp. IBT 16267x]
MARLNQQFRNWCNVRFVLTPVTAVATLTQKSYHYDQSNTAIIRTGQASFAYVSMAYPMEVYYVRGRSNDPLTRHLQ